MSHSKIVEILIGVLCLHGFLSPRVIADNGTVVSGAVIAIDPLNQIIRVHVTGVNSQQLYGSPLTNYVDYLVSPETVVVGPNNQFVSQANVLVGSPIHMQFSGAFATAIVLVDNMHNDIYNQSNLGHGVTPVFNTTLFTNIGTVSPYSTSYAGWYAGPFIGTTYVQRSFPIRRSNQTITLPRKNSSTMNHPVLTQPNVPKSKTNTIPIKNLQQLHSVLLKGGVTVHAHPHTAPRH